MALQTVTEAIQEYLTSIGADGLCTEDCGCAIDDLFPCGSCTGGCVPAKRIQQEDPDAEWFDEYIFSEMTKEDVR